LRAAHAFIEDIATVGKNLYEYGEVEYSVYQSRKLLSSWDPGPDPRILGFVYGSVCGDWKFWVTEPTDRYAGEFWEMPEWEVKASTASYENDSLPGSWLD